MTGSVLLVEDEENLASLVQAYLEREGYSVLAVGTGSEALSVLAQQPVRLVVLDLALPDIDGPEVCRQIRAQSSVPVVMLTAEAGPRDREVMTGLGAHAVLAKPISGPALLQAVRNAIGDA